jgi:hypothetical protein
MFADDIIVYREIVNGQDCETLQVDLANIEKWVHENKMELNVKKSQLVRFTKKQSRIMFEYKLAGEVVGEGKYCKYLGVTIGRDLSWAGQVGQVVGRAYRALYMVMRALKGCEKEVKEMAYISMVRPHLDYCSAVWDPYQGYLVKELEGVQRKAARFVMNDFGRLSSVSAMLRELGWCSLEGRRRVGRLVGMFKACSGEASWKDIRDRLDWEEGYRGRRDHGYRIVRKGTRREVGLHSFVGKGVKEWNELPAVVFDPFPSSEYSFKRRLVECTLSC